jgi:hypothetical protein
MTIESDVHAAIATVCPRVFPVLAPIRTQRPYVTVQNIGGRPIYAIDRIPADKRVLRLFVKTWASSKAEALQLIRQIEAALMAVPMSTFITRVESEPLDDLETDVEPWLYSELQEFVVIGPR